MKSIKLLLIIFGALGIIDTLVILSFSNFNLGVVLPAVIGTPLLAVGIFYEKFLLFAKTPFGKWVNIVLIVGYAFYALFMLVMSIIIFSKANEPTPKDADAIIVLGCGVRGERISLTLKYRIDKAIEYLEDNPNTLAVLSGGKGNGENISEAEAMRRYMLNRGIDENRLLIEDRSTSTYENFAFSMEIIKNKFTGEPKLAFVTTGFHVLRAGLVAKQQGIDAVGIGAKDVPYIGVNNYMRESLALALYKLKGMA